MAASRHCIGFAVDLEACTVWLCCVQYNSLNAEFQFSLSNRDTLCILNAYFVFAVHATARREKNHFMHEANGEFKMDKFSI